MFGDHLVFLVFLEAVVRKFTASQMNAEIFLRKHPRCSTISLTSVIIKRHLLSEHGPASGFG